NKFIVLLWSASLVTDQALTDGGLPCGCFACLPTAAERIIAFPFPEPLTRASNFLFLITYFLTKIFIKKQLVLNSQK
ncbi:MAG: hypothetical protein WCG67_09045, partial [Ferruginibacter sp.]